MELSGSRPGYWSLFVDGGWHGRMPGLTRRSGGLLAATAEHKRWQAPRSYIRVAASRRPPVSAVKRWIKLGAVCG